MSSFRSHRDDGGTTVGVQLAQSDIDLLGAGIPVELDAQDESEPVRSVHIAKDRRGDATVIAEPDSDAAEWHSI